MKHHFIFHILPYFSTFQACCTTISTKTPNTSRRSRQALWNWWIKDLLYLQRKMLFNNLLLLFATTDCIWLFLPWSKPQEDKLRKTTSSISQCLRNAIQEAKRGKPAQHKQLWDELGSFWSQCWKAVWTTVPPGQSPRWMMNMQTF